MPRLPSQPVDRDARNRAMWVLRLVGWSSAAIGRAFGLTREGVAKILDKFPHKAPK